MDPRTLKARRSVKNKAVAVPRIPQDIIDEILDYLAADSAFDVGSLQSCALISKSWVSSCRRHLFHTILFTSARITRWLKTFPVPEGSPAHYVRDLHLSVWDHDRVPPEEFSKHTPWFTNVERMTLSGGHGSLQQLSVSSVWQSVTSLTININSVTPLQIRDVMVRLPNLDDLSFSGYPDNWAPPGIGTVASGRFGGQLQLSGGTTGSGIVDMLLEIPTGLHFTEVHIRSAREYLLSTVMLVEACAKTLVKLSYMVSFQRESHPSSWLLRAEYRC